jgi:hypothetical protein
MVNGPLDFILHNRQQTDDAMDETSEASSRPPEATTTIKTTTDLNAYFEYRNLDFSYKESWIWSELIEIHLV